MPGPLATLGLSCVSSKERTLFVALSTRPAIASSNALKAVASRSFRCTCPSTSSRTLSYPTRSPVKIVSRDANPIYVVEGSLFEFPALCPVSLLDPPRNILRRLLPPDLQLLVLDVSRVRSQTAGSAEASVSRSLVVREGMRTHVTFVRPSKGLPEIKGSSS